MATVTRTQLENAAIDADSFGSIINGNDTTVVTTRLGQNVKTIAKAIKDGEDELDAILLLASQGADSVEEFVTIANAGAVLAEGFKNETEAARDTTIDAKDDTLDAKDDAVDAATSAQTNKDLVQAYYDSLGSLGPFESPMFASKLSADIATIDPAADYLRTNGYSAPGADGEAIYKEYLSDPTDIEAPGKFQDASRWFGITGRRLTPSQFGAVGDDATNDTTAMTACIKTAMRLGATVDLENKTYYCASWATITTLGPLAIIGKDGAALRGNNTSNFINVVHSIYADNFKLSGFGTAFDMQTVNITMGDIILKRIKCIDAGALILGQNATGLRMGRMTIQNCYINPGLSGGIGRAQGIRWQNNGFTDVFVIGNVLRNCNFQGIRIGSFPWSNPNQKSIWIVNNKVEGVYGNGQQNGIQVFGTRFFVIGNLVKDIVSYTGTTDIEAIYTVGEEGHIVNNTIVDGGSNQGFLACKSSTSVVRGNKLIGNIKYNQKNFIEAEGDQVTIENNELIWNWEIIYPSLGTGDAFAITTFVPTVNNAESVYEYITFDRSNTTTSPTLDKGTGALALKMGNSRGTMPIGWIVPGKDYTLQYESAGNYAIMPMAERDEGIDNIWESTSVNHYTGTDTSIVSLADGVRTIGRPRLTNTSTTVDFNLNSLGAKAIKYYLNGVVTALPVSGMNFNVAHELVFSVAEDAWLQVPLTITFKGAKVRFMHGAANAYSMRMPAGYMPVDGDQIMYVSDFTSLTTPDAGVVINALSSIPLIRSTGQNIATIASLIRKGRLGRLIYRSASSSFEYDDLSNYAGIFVQNFVTGNTVIRGNTFQKMHLLYGIHPGGGKNVVIEGNKSIDCNYGLGYVHIGSNSGGIPSRVNIKDNILSHEDGDLSRCPVVFNVLTGLRRVYALDNIAYIGGATLASMFQFANLADTIAYVYATRNRLISASTAAYGLNLTRPTLLICDDEQFIYAALPTASLEFLHKTVTIQHGINTARYVCEKRGVSTYAWVSADAGLVGAATFNPASLADAAGATTTVAVTGAALGDLAFATFSLDLQGITVTAWVSAVDTVSVRFQNETGGVLDLASGTLKALVRKI